MNFKSIFLVASLIFSMACSACGPAEVETDGGQDSEEVEYPFVSWDTCSQKSGDHPCNFTLKDQHGNDVSLYDFYGDTVIIDFSVMWCGPCQIAAAEVQDVSDRLKDEDFTYITILIENLAAQPPSQEDCQGWADVYGINEPVLQGSRELLDISGESGWPLESWPTFYFIDDEMVLNTSLKGFSSSYIDMLIEDTMSK